MRCLVTALLKKRVDTTRITQKAVTRHRTPRRRPMSRFKSNLDRVRVAAPCHVDWDTMFGDERVRFCGQCKLNVYNLSEMTRVDAELLVGRSEGRLCIRYYQRRDGSIITQNCPVGLRAIKRRLSRVASAIASTLLTFLAGIGAYGVADRLSLLRHNDSHYLMGVMAVEPKVGVTYVVTGELVPIEKMKSKIRKRR